MINKMLQAMDKFFDWIGQSNTNSLIREDKIDYLNDKISLIIGIQLFEQIRFEKRFREMLLTSLEILLKGFF